MARTTKKVGEFQRRIGERIEARRKGLAWTREKLAEVSGLSAMGLFRIEKGQRWPQPENFEKLAKALGVPVEAFFSSEVVHIQPTVNEALSVIVSALSQVEIPRAASHIPADVLEQLERVQNWDLMRRTLAVLAKEPAKKVAHIG